MDEWDGRDLELPIRLAQDPQNREALCTPAIINAACTEGGERGAELLRLLADCLGRVPPAVLDFALANKRMGVLYALARDNAPAMVAHGGMMDFLVTRIAIDTVRVLAARDELRVSLYEYPGLVEMAIAGGWKGRGVMGVLAENADVAKRMMHDARVMDYAKTHPTFFATLRNAAA